MFDCKEMATLMVLKLKLLCNASLETIYAIMYSHMIGSFMYLMNTRLDICFDVNTLSQFLMDPRHVHLVAKNVLRYLKGTIEYGLKYDTNQKTNLHGYVDLDWEGSTTNRNRTLLEEISTQNGPSKEN